MREPRLLQEADGGRPGRRRVRPAGRAVVEANLRAHGFRFTLRVHSYEFPVLQSGSDANWLNAEVEAEIGAFGARHSITVLADELERFRDGLRALDAKRADEAELVHLEEEIGLTIRLERGKGALSGFVLDHAGPELRFGDVEIDRSFVRAALAELDALVTAFPVRGKPWG